MLTKGAGGVCSLCRKDVMENIIQVGRPAVSRYHQQRRFYMVGQGPNHTVHDWAISELGIKLGGFMFINAKPKRKRSASAERWMRA